MKYLIAIYSNQESRAEWDEISDAEKLDRGRVMRLLTEQLADSGELITSEGLADPSQAKRVQRRDGQIFTTDGPFAEVKEHLVGFYLIECETMARAVEVAAAVPDAASGRVEVRPVLNFAYMDV